MTQLLEALYRGDRDAVDGLLTADPTLNVFEAAALGRTDRLGELLDEEPTRANAFGDDGFHPGRPLAASRRLPDRMPQPYLAIYPRI